MAKTTQTAKLALSLLTASSLTLTGCELFEDLGITEAPSSGVQFPPPTFDVSTDPEDPAPQPGDNTSNPPPDPVVDIDIEEGFIVNGGLTRTRDSLLSFEFITLNRNGIKVSFNHTCDGGVWEPYQRTKLIETPLTNRPVPISVRFRDFDNREGNCFRQSIVHDNLGPNINFTKYPLANLEEGSTAQIIADVTDDLSQVSEVTCALNGLQKPCFPGRNEVNITQLPVGDYTFSISSRDELGNSRQASVRWSVVSISRQITQLARLNDYRRVDILFVIDNSGSMEYEQRSMGQRTSNFLQVLRGLDYQIAITTTDPRNVTLGDGRFLPLRGYSNRFIIDSSMTESEAQTTLSSTLQRTETGSPEEQGIRAAYRTIDRYIANENNARAFFREGAQFAVVLISDEDESASTTKNDPEALVAHVASTFGGSKMFSYHSIITIPGDTACRGTDGYAYGHRYQQMSQLTGGVIGSVCAMDYAAQVTGIAEGIRDLLKTITLQCQPLAGRPITVRKDGVEVSQSFRVDGLNLKFDNELLPGDYSVTYHCLKD